MKKLFPGHSFPRLNEDGSFQIGDETNYILFSPDGEISLHGNARVLRELAFPLEGIGKGATAPTVTRLANSYGWAFTIGDDGYACFEVPLDWDSSTSIEITMHLYVDEAYAFNSAEVRFQGTWSASPEDGSEAIDAATHTGTLDSGDINIPATAKAEFEISLGSIPAASLAAHDIVHILFSRIALAAGNDPAAEPVVTAVEYEWTANKLGELL